MPTLILIGRIIVWGLSICGIISLLKGGIGNVYLSFIFGVAQIILVVMLI